MKTYLLPPQDPDLLFWKNQAHHCRLRLTEAAHLLHLLTLDPHTFRPDAQRWLHVHFHELQGKEA